MKKELNIENAISAGLNLVPGMSLAIPGAQASNLPVKGGGKVVLQVPAGGAARGAAGSLSGVKPDGVIDQSFESLVELHGVRSQEKVEYLTADMGSRGWVGPPVLVYDAGNGAFALTGSHRIAAAKIADVPVPVVYYDVDAVDSWAGEQDKTIDDLLAGDDVSKLEAAKEVGDHRAVALLEDELLRNEADEN